MFRNKPGGLMVDYLSLADALKRALHTYSASGGQGQATVDHVQAVMLEESVRKYQNRAIEAAQGHRRADQAGERDP